MVTVYLQEILDLRIEEKGSSDSELEDLCEKIIKYSVKTSKWFPSLDANSKIIIVATAHPHFYNQLYAGVNQYGLAGAWLSDALNTSQ